MRPAKFLVLALPAMLLLGACPKSDGPKLSNERLAALSNKRPTLRWESAMKESPPDPHFTRDAIDDANRAIDEWLAALDGLEKPSKESALPLLEKVVKAMNKLNEQHGPIIETLERDELVPYFEDALEAVGVKYGDDPTEQWRDW